MNEPNKDDHVQVAARYFRSFASDYTEAFRGTGKHWLHRSLNRLFRRRTFQERTERVQDLLESHRVEGKRVLDLGCGSGEVSLMAASLGAKVTGLDVVPEMIAIARDQAKAAGWETQTKFEVADLTSAPLPEADVTLIIGVIEYYADITTLLERACHATREKLIIVDARGPWWRRGLRHGLARWKKFYLYYRTPEAVREAVECFGFKCEEEQLAHSYTVLSFSRR